MDKATICNMALAHIKAARITTLSERSEEAEYCNIFYDTARKATLEAFNWSFARKNMALVQMNEYTGDDFTRYGFTYRYAYPSDCAKARYIPRAGTAGRPFSPYADTYEPQRYVMADAAAIPARFKLELGDTENRRTILTNEEDAVLVYTKDITDTNLFNGQFVLALSYHLAGLLGTPLGKGRSDFDRWMGAFNEYMAGVAESDANEDYDPNPEEVNEFLQARF